MYVVDSKTKSKHKGFFSASIQESLRKYLRGFLIGVFKLSFWICKLFFLNFSENSFTLSFCYCEIFEIFD